MQIRTQNALIALDTDKNGLIISELNALDADGDNRISKDEFYAATGVSIDQTDLNKINTRLAKTKEYNAAFSFIDNVYERSELNSALFPNGSEGISYRDAVQGGVGDCYLISALASLAQHRPGEIINMIRDNGNGTFTVKLPAMKKAVTVEKPTEDELNKYAGKGENGGIWSAVTEKAYAKYVRENKWFPDKEPRADIESGSLSDGITIVTGHSTDSDIFAFTRKGTTREKIQSNLEAGRLVTVGTYSGKASKNIGKKHAFSVISYNSASDSVKVRDQRGSGYEPKDIANPDGVDDGVFTLTIDELDDYFSDIAYEDAA